MNKKNNFNQKTYSRGKKPGYEHYKNMLAEFRPYIMFTNSSNFKSKIANTDRLGFRKVAYKGKLFGIDKLKKYSKTINILLGGSTAFSMGSLSDKNTIHSELSNLKKLCFSLGMRGASSHQELISFLKFKNFFPEVKNIIILSGVNDLAIAAEEDSIFYPDFGSVMGARHHALNFLIQSGSHYKAKWIKGMHNFFFYIHYLANKSKNFKRFLSLFSYFKQGSLQKKTATFLNQGFEKRIKNLNRMLSNDFDTWSIIQRQLKINIIYVFQPVLSWTNKPLTNYESQILQSEKKDLHMFYMKKWYDKTIYRKQRDFIKNCCYKRGIKFIDGSQIILKSDHKKDFFIDLTHFTSYGNKFMARNINKFLID